MFVRLRKCCRECKFLKFNKKVSSLHNEKEQFINQKSSRNFFNEKIGKISSTIIGLIKKEEKAVKGLLLVKATILENIEIDNYSVKTMY
ncbi:hypothetical protein [Wolbachia endosymbiont of Onchocerca volvulus]|nr:hypothetical protein [Wolbachia endosymbiont of Onchocerca volvulus]